MYAQSAQGLLEALRSISSGFLGDRAHEGEGDSEPMNLKAPKVE